MAITIITRGTPPSEYLYTSTCTACQSVFTYLRKDATFIPGDQREPGYLRIDCPVCREILQKNPSNYTRTTTAWLKPRGPFPER